MRPIQKNFTKNFTHLPKRPPNPGFSSNYVNGTRQSTSASLVTQFAPDSSLHPLQVFVSRLIITHSRFLIPELHCQSSNVVKFYNKRGTAE